MRKMRREKKRAAQQVAQFAESCRLLQNRFDDSELDLSKKAKEFLREKALRMEPETKLEGGEKKTARAIDALQKTVETARGTASETAEKLDASTRSLADTQQQLAVVQRGLSIKNVQFDTLQRELDKTSEAKLKAEDKVHALKARVVELEIHASEADESRGAARSQLERQQGAMADRDERSRLKETELRDELQAVKDEFAKHSDAIAAAQRKGVEAEQRYSAFGVRCSVFGVRHAVSREAARCVERTARSHARARPPLLPSLVPPRQIASDVRGADSRNFDGDAPRRRVGIDQACGGGEVACGGGDEARGGVRCARDGHPRGGDPVCGVAKRRRVGARHGARAAPRPRRDAGEV